MKRLILLLLALLLAGPTFAGAWSSSCNFTGGNFIGTVGTPTQGVTVTGITTLPAAPPGNLAAIGDSTTACYRFNNADSTHLAGPFVVSAPSAQIVFDPSLNTAGALTATVIPHVCGGMPYGGAVVPTSFNCPSMGGANGNASLTGLEGADSVQNATKWIGPGLYYLEISAACVAANTCNVMIRGSR